jgi:type III secretory pathway component EscT
MPGSELVHSLLEALEIDAQQWERWWRAWARLLPIVVIVPAFGLRAVPGPVRVVLGFSLGLAIAPALEPSAPSGPWWIELCAEFAQGLPVAVVAATALWLASMTGGLIDNLRGGQESAPLPNVESNSTPMGALLTMLVAVAFLQGGGATQAAAAVARSEPVSHRAVLSLANTLAGGISLAVAVAAPILAVAIVVEVAGALVARAASPAFIQPTLAPLRALAILGAAAVLMDRIAEFLALAALAW